MAVYRNVVYILESCEPPPGGTVVTMDAKYRKRSLGALSILPAKYAEWSGGMGSLHIEVKYIPWTVGPDLYYVTGTGGQVPAGDEIATVMGDLDTYDHYGVMTTKAQTEGMGGFVGFANIDRWWAMADDPRLPYIAAHEEWHNIERHMTANGYTNWALCDDYDGDPPGQSIHCGQELGYGNDLNDRWFSVLMSGTIAGGFGANATAWAIETPTEQGSRTIALPNRLSPGPWGGEIGPVIFPSAI